MISPASEVPSAMAKADSPPTPRADVGVLFVHGIGNHLEGATLMAFGQPMLDWLKQWLGQKEGGAPRGEVEVSEAQFGGGDAPAYALAKVTTASRQVPAATGTESWLFCEGWWGAVVQPPPSLQLLRWMWTRGPLLIYWHFYVRGTADGRKSEENFGDTVSSIFALFLAGFCQTIVSLAIVLWLIPIGPWRRSVIAAVKALTLTLGDSYVLEQDIQRAALVERVRRALEWLAARCDQAVIIAHSQGGAIAHEMVQKGAPANLKLFCSLGSGLEKLHFLREVLAVRKGLVSASLVFPVFVLGIFFIASGAFSGGERWPIALGGFLEIMALGFGGALLGQLRNYKTRLAATTAKLELPGLGRRRWIDLYASEDVVPMSKGSLLNRARFLSRRQIYNERSYVRDHLAYFSNPSDCLHRLWTPLARLSRLRFFERGERDRLERFACVHQAYAHLVYWSRLGLFLAIFISAIALRNSLLLFSNSVLRNIAGTPVEDWLKPLRALAAGLAWILQKLWRPDVVSADTLADALFGALVLLAGWALYWVVFRATWLAACRARWRKACRGGDIARTRGQRLWFVVRLILFFGFGLLPLLGSILFATSPGYLTLRAFGNAVTLALAGLTLVIAFFYAAAAPWASEGMWQNEAESRWLRIGFPGMIAVMVLLLLLLARWLRPTALGPAGQGAVVAGFALVMTIAWQIFGFLKLRGSSPVWCAAIVAFPILGAVAWFWWRSASSLGPALLAYIALSALVLLAAFGRHLLQVRKAKS